MVLSLVKTLGLFFSSQVQASPCAAHTKRSISECNAPTSWHHVSIQSILQCSFTHCGLTSIKSDTDVLSAFKSPPHNCSTFAVNVVALQSAVHYTRCTEKKHSAHVQLNRLKICKWVSVKQVPRSGEVFKAWKYIVAFWCICSDTPCFKIVLIRC